MIDIPAEFRHPHRPTMRRILRRLARLTLKTLTRFEVLGQENIPNRGPLLVVANHFYFADPVAALAVLPFPLEFFAGTDRPAAPTFAKWIPDLWKVYPVGPGSSSRYALKAAEQIMQQNGVLGIFPEGGAWSQVLRPLRPGTAYVATRTGAPILPIGIAGMAFTPPTRSSALRPKRWPPIPGRQTVSSNRNTFQIRWSEHPQMRTAGAKPTLHLRMLRSSQV